MFQSNVRFVNLVYWTASWVATNTRVLFPYCSFVFQQIQSNFIVVIHPGSKALRIGRATDTLPVIVPHVIARKHKQTGQPKYEDPWLLREGLDVSITTLWSTILMLCKMKSYTSFVKILCLLACHTFLTWALHSLTEARKQWTKAEWS